MRKKMKKRKESLPASLRNLNTASKLWTQNTDWWRFNWMMTSPNCWRLLFCKPDGSARVFRDACDKVLENCSFTLQSKVEQHPAVTSLLDGTTFLAVLPTGFRKCFIFQLFVIVAEMEIKRRHTTLVVCPLQSIIDEMKTRFQRPETWVFQLHLKDSWYLNPKKKETKLACGKNWGLFAVCVQFASFVG